MKSMTGFGSASCEIASSQLSIEIKSVNHRYLEAKFRLPQPLAQFEVVLLKTLRNKCARGAFEVNVRFATPLQMTSLSQTQFVVDAAAAKAFQKCCEEVGSLLSIETRPTMDAVLRTNKIIVAVDSPADIPSLDRDLDKCFLAALDSLEKNRSAEGAHLKSILEKGIGELISLSKEFKQYEDDQTAQLRKTLQERIDGWNLPTQIDPQRLEAEIAFLAEKSDFREELDRLGVHLAEFKKKLESTAEIGRALDFLLQEIYRELNTLGAKTTLLPVSQAVLQAKGIVEKLKQQVQNVE